MESAPSIAARRRFPVANLLLFVATVLTTLLAGAGTSGAPFDFAHPLSLLLSGLPFSAALLGILGAHEMGHYVAARLYGVDATLPFFIPMPLSPVGTLGAFIRIRSAFPTRDAIMDIGAAGPLAGFVVALPLVFIGFATSPVVTLPAELQAVHAQSLYALVASHLRGETGAMPGIIMGDSLLTFAAAHLTHTIPAGSDVALGPVAMAAWFGLFVTGLNLVPIGQLDGGHVLYALFGERARRYSLAASWVLFALGIAVSWNWLVWWALVRFLLGVRHPPATFATPLTPKRRLVGLASLVVFVLTFVPVPFYF